MNQQQWSDDDKSLASTIGKVSSVLGSDSFSTGDRAALRRMQPGQNPPLAYFRFALRYLPSSWEQQLDDWIAITAGIALMSPQAHDPERKMGRALAEVGFSEERLERLLSSDGEVRRLLLLRAARFLAAKSKAMNWVEGAQLLLTPKGERRESLHRRIAKDFYDVLVQAEQREEKE